MDMCDDQKFKYHKVKLIQTRLACEERRENLYDRVYSNDGGGGGGGPPEKTTHCRYNIFGLSPEPNISAYPPVSSIIIILWPVDSYLFFPPPLPAPRLHESSSSGVFIPSDH